MPEVVVEKPKTLDVLEQKGPALSATNWDSTGDMPVVETKPDVSAPEKKDETKEDAKAAPEEGKTKEESATSPAEPAASDEEPAKRPAKGVQKRLDELTRQREEADRRARAAEERLDRLMKAIDEGRVHPASTDAAPIKQAEEPKAPEDVEPERPKRADFSDPEAWDAAILKYADEKAAWTARREVASARQADQRAQAERAQREATQAIIDAHNARVKEIEATHADFHEVAESADVQISIPVASAIMQHEQGPELQYYLGSHPEVAKAMLTKPIPAQLLELGAIAASLKAQKSAPVASAAAAPKPITSAPAPLKPVDKGTGTVTKSPEEMSMEEYAAMRRPQLQAERRPGGKR